MLQKLIVFSCVALPLWAAMFMMLFITKKKDMPKESIIPKCAGSFLSIASVVFYYFASPDKASSPLGLFTWLFFWFFVLCTVGDAVLEISFVPGMGCFAAAHICLIIMLFPMASRLVSGIIWVCVMILATVLFRRELKEMGIGMVVPCVIYMGILSATLSLSLPAPFVDSANGPSAAGAWLLAAGALSVYVSDLLVAKAFFGKWGDKHDKLIMFLYWLALYLISSSMWVGKAK